MTDTPISDASRIVVGHDEVVLYQVAQELERKLYIAEAKLSAMLLEFKPFKI